MFQPKKSKMQNKYRVRWREEKANEVITFDGEPHGTFLAHPTFEITVY